MTNNYNEADRFDGKGIGRVFADERVIETSQQYEDALRNNHLEAVHVIGEKEIDRFISSRYEAFSNSHLL